MMTKKYSSDNNVIDFLKSKKTLAFHAGKDFETNNYNVYGWLRELRDKGFVTLRFSNEFFGPNQQTAPATATRTLLFEYTYM